MSERWSRGWRVGPKRADALRHSWCLLAGHIWQTNPRRTQRVCGRCWWCQNATPTDQPEEVRCGGEEETDV